MDCSVWGLFVIEIIETGNVDGIDIPRKRVDKMRIYRHEEDALSGGAASLEGGGSRNALGLPALPIPKKKRLFRVSRPN